MRQPGFYRDYPSKMVSDYHCWFRDLGYPELDLVRYPDGEWAIIQFMQTPIIPCLTKWNFVLKGLRNVELTHSFIARYVQQLDLEKHTVWEEQAKTERLALEETNYEERRAQDRAEHFVAGIRGNDAMMQRIARNGLRELNPRRMLNHISRSKLGKGYQEN